MAGRDHRARRGTARGRDAAARHRRDADRRRDPGLVPERRAAGPRRDARRPAATCSSGSAATRPRPASSSPSSAGTRSRAGSSSSPPSARARGPAPPLRRRPRAAGRLRRLRAVPRPRPARAVRPRQPGPARRRPRAHRATRPGRQRRPHPARPAPRPRRRSTGSRSAAPTSPPPSSEGDRVDVVARLASRVFGGLETLQLEVRDVAPSGLAPAGPRGPRPHRGGPRAGRPGRPADRAPERARMSRARPAPSGRRAGPRTRTGCCPPGRRSPPILSVGRASLVIGLVIVALGSGQLPIGGRVGQRRPAARRERRPRRHPHADAVERGHRPHRAAGPRDPGHARLRQGRQRLGPGRRRGHAAHDGGNDSMPSFSAGRHRGLLRPDARGRRRLERRRRDQGLSTGRARDHARRRRRRRRHARILDGLVDPAGPPQVDGLHPRAGRLARTATRSPWPRDLPDPTQSDVTLKLLNLREQEDHGPQARPGPAARPPGSGVAPGRRAAGVRPRRPRRRQGHAPDLPVHARDREDARGHRPGLPPPRLVARRPVPRRDPDQRHRHGRGDPRRARPAPSSLRLTNDGDSWAPTWSPAGDQIAFLHVAGQVVDLRHGPARGHRARLDGQGGRSTSRPARASTASPDRTGSCPEDQLPRAHGGPRGVARPARDDATPYLERLAARTAATGQRPVCRHRPGPGRAARRVPRDARRRRAVLPPAPRGGAAARRGGQAQPRLLRGARLGRDRRPRAAARARPGGRPVRRRREARATSGPRRERQAVALYDALGADAVTVNPYLGEEAIAPLLARGGPVRLRPVPDLQPRRRRAPGPGAWPRTSARGIRPSRCGPGSPGGRPRGARAGRSGSSSARRRPRSWRAIRGDRAGPRVPRPGRRGAGRRARAGAGRGARDGSPGRREGGRRTARQRVAGHRAGGARRPRRGCSARTPASVSRRPPPSGPRASLCYPDALLKASGRRSEQRGQTQVMPFNIGPGELIIVLIIALIVVGPGKLPDVGSALGKSIREFRKAATDVKESTSLDRRRARVGRPPRLRDAADPAPSPRPSPRSRPPPCRRPSPSVPPGGRGRRTPPPSRRTSPAVRPTSRVVRP